MKYGCILCFALASSTLSFGTEEDTFDVLRLKLKEFQTFHIEPHGDLNQVITNKNLNRKECKTSADCSIDETCQKVCFWLNPEDLWVGCKINCVPTTEAILYEVLIRKESGFLPNQVLESATLRSDTTQAGLTASTPSRVEETVKAPDNTHLTGFQGQLDSVSSQSEVAINASDTKALDQVSCPPTPICPMLCSVSIDENGCQKCSCTQAKKPGNCMLNHHCGDLNQYCLRSKKRCVCREGFVVVQENPLRCAPESTESESASQGTTIPLATSTASPPPSQIDTHRTPANFPRPQHFGEGIRKQAYKVENGDPESNMFSELHKADFEPLADDSQSLLTTESLPGKKRTFNPASFWRALVVISGTTSAPAITEKGGDGELTSRCRSSSDCQPGLQCCVKSYCDGYNSCGTAYFCLSKCSIE